MTRTRLVLLAALFWLVVGLVAVVGQKINLWCCLQFSAKDYGVNDIE